MVGAVLLLLAAVLVPASRSPHMAVRIHCVNNLKQVGDAFHLWKADNRDLYPMNVPVASGGAQELIATGNVAAVFQVMSNQLASPKILFCPGDAFHTAATNFNLTPANMSYFISLSACETNPATLLSGDANLLAGGRPVSAGILNLWTNSPTWTSDRHGGSGNMLVADGSVQALAKMGFASDVGTYYATNRIVVP